MLLDHTKLTSIDQMLRALKDDLAGEEKLWLSLEGKVRAEGDEEDLYALWVTLFGVYSRHGERTKALELLDRMNGLRVSAEVDCSCLIAQWLYDGLDEPHLAQVYIDRAYAVESQEGGHRLPEYWVHRMRCLELHLLARHDPTSPRLISLLTELEAADGHPGRVDERLVSALTRLASSGIVPPQVRSMLERLKKQLSQQLAMDRYDIAYKAEVEEALRQLTS
jgi:hypothetical protein